MWILSGGEGEEMGVNPELIHTVRGEGSFFNNTGGTRCGRQDRSGRGNILPNGPGERA